MRSSIAIILFLGFAVSGHASARPHVGPGDTPASSPLSLVPKSEKLACVLTVEPVSQVFRIPEITVTLTNQTGSDIYLLGSLDASDCRWRYPHCYFEVIGPDGKPASDAIGRCGNVNPLQERDFVRVPAGGAFDPFHSGAGYPAFTAHQISPYTFRVPGKYRIRFFYSTASEVMTEWAGDGRQELVELLRLVPKVEVASDEVVVEVVAPGERR